MQLHRVVNEAGEVVGYAILDNENAIAFDEKEIAIKKFEGDVRVKLIGDRELLDTEGMGHDIAYKEIQRIIKEPVNDRTLTINYFTVTLASDFKLVERLNSGGSTGNLTKWMFKDFIGKSWVKGRRKPHTLEPETEVCCYRLARLFGISATPQALVNISELSDKPLSISRDFTNGRPVTSLFKYFHTVQDKESKDYTGLEKFRVIESILNDNCKMAHLQTLWFDYIVGNDDRHLRNIELFLDSAGVAEDFVPMFDMGASLFSESLDIEIERACARKENYVHSRPYADPHFAQIKLLREAGYEPNLCKVERKEIYKIINSCFTDKRAKLLGKYVCNNTERLGLLR